METELLVKLARITKAPSDGKGEFDFVIAAFNLVDSDREIIEGFVGLDDDGSETEVDIDYGHMRLIGDGGDPEAGKIGTATVWRHGDLLRGAAKLDLENRVAQMVHERLLLDKDDPAHLGEVSVFFAYDRANSSVDGEGVRTIREARLLSISVVKAGAQKTVIENVKRAWKARKIAASGTPAQPVTRSKLVDAFGGPEGLRAAMDRALAKHTLAKLRKPKLLWDEPAWHKKSIADMAARSAAIDTARAAKAKKDKAMRLLIDAAPQGVMRTSTRVDRNFRVINDPVVPAPSGPPETFRVPQGPVDDGPVRGRRP